MGIATLYLGQQSEHKPCCTCIYSAKFHKNGKCGVQLSSIQLCSSTGGSLAIMLQRACKGVSLPDCATVI